MNYHSVAPAGHRDPLRAFGRSFRVEDQLFRGQMGILARRFSIVPLETLVAQLTDGALRPRQACVTFDDGYADNYEYAFPILQRLGIPATVFLITARVEDGKPFVWELLASVLAQRADRSLVLPRQLGSREIDLGSPQALRHAFDDLAHRLRAMESGEARDGVLEALADEAPRRYSRPLTWREAETMQRAGVTLGAHSHSHLSLTALADPVLREEIVRCRDLIALRLGRTPTLFAYPYGAVDARVRHAVERAAFVGAVTSDERPCASESCPLLLPRIEVGNWEPRRFTRHLDRIRHAGRGKVRSWLKAVLPAPIIAAGKRFRAGRRIGSDRMC